MKIGIVGLGHMGKALVKGFIPHQVDIVGKATTQEKAKSISEELQIEVFSNDGDFLKTNPDIVILSTPAKIVIDVLKTLKNNGLPDETIILSSAGGISFEQLHEVASENPVACFMPNTPVAIGAGTISFAENSSLNIENITVIKNQLSKLGDVITISENQLNIAGTIGGCAPAFIDVLMDAMEDAGVHEGLDRKTAHKLIASVVKGSGLLALDSDKNFSELKGQVTSPGGSTIKGVLSLEKDNFRNAVINAVLASNGN
ncbi:pyrroline-5-carboxylate reductase [Leuconostoc litchii]|uniref:Pyrroline-5-carboxylate reductase n=1 Tax=Leuconostoc litchii TaxID=1981069 RepID=A0A6P2CNZ4_9LACO|nr:pyrroline-5-carboxylate reductase [Leuconostoc litchii]TYC47103.1 pyrroline-5-carboxylate reductase [Leuconostoc litchii]GMA69048.1 pyrroline-5-carboxylate reductase [Leuconostoc litchii]